MLSRKPYLVRAIYDWIVDSDYTPYVLVDASVTGVDVPAHVVQGGQVVLNIGLQAVNRFSLDQEGIAFEARFSGQLHRVFLPTAAIVSLYARENGEGMVFPNEEVNYGESGAVPEKGATLQAVKTDENKAETEVVAEHEVTEEEASPSDKKSQPSKKPPGLHIVK